MERTSKSPTVDVSRRSALTSREGPVSWEYRFSDESPSTGGTAVEGWTVVSSSTRRDHSREYLLKRPLR
jgi:hypothetical protein